MPDQTYATIAHEETDKMASRIRSGEKLVSIANTWTILDVEEEVMKNIRMRVIDYNARNKGKDHITYKQVLSEDYIMTIMEAALVADPWMSAEEILAKPGLVEKACLDINANLTSASLRNIRRRLERLAEKT